MLLLLQVFKKYIYDIDIIEDDDIDIIEDINNLLSLYVSVQSNTKKEEGEGKIDATFRGVRGGESDPPPPPYACSPEGGTHMKNTKISLLPLTKKNH